MVLVLVCRHAVPRMLALCILSKAEYVQNRLSSTTLYECVVSVPKTRQTQENINKIMLRKHQDRPLEPCPGSQARVQLVSAGVYPQVQARITFDIVHFFDFPL